MPVPLFWLVSLSVMHILANSLNTSSSTIADRTGLLSLCSLAPCLFPGHCFCEQLQGSVITDLGRQFCCFLLPHSATEQVTSLYCALTLPSGRPATCQLSFLSSVAILFLLLQSHGDIFSKSLPKNPQLLSRPFHTFVSWNHIPGHSANLCTAD